MTKKTLDQITIELDNAVKGLRKIVHPTDYEIIKEESNRFHNYGERVLTKIERFLNTSIHQSKDETKEIDSLTNIDRLSTMIYGQSVVKALLNGYNGGDNPHLQRQYGGNIEALNQFKHVTDLMHEADNMLESDLAKYRNDNDYNKAVSDVVNHMAKEISRDTIKVLQKKINIMQDGIGRKATRDISYILQQCSKGSTQLSGLKHNPDNANRQINKIFKKFNENYIDNNYGKVDGDNKKVRTAVEKVLVEARILYNAIELYNKEKPLNLIN